MSQSKERDFWNERYLNNTTGWDLGMPSPPLTEYIDSLSDKNLKILIPGSGNSYEAHYLIEKGFTDITIIDIAPAVIQKLIKHFKHSPQLHIIEGDFFEHQGKYDIILEQTFFCAIPPAMRQKYCVKMAALLTEKGQLAGLLFNRQFEGGPPFGGSEIEYRELIGQHLNINSMGPCLNSIAPRMGTELFFTASKKKDM